MWREEPSFRPDVFVGAFFHSSPERLEIKLRRDESEDQVPVIVLGGRYFGDNQDYSNICIGVAGGHYEFQEWEFADIEMGVALVDAFLRKRKLPVSG